MSPSDLVPRVDPARPTGFLTRALNRAERWAERHWGRAIGFFEERAVDLILRRLDEDLPHYDLRVPNDMANLMKVVQQADVILVEGRRRISFVIQKITSSPWSHATLYVGNGQVIEAQDYGVVISPIMKYADHNIRLCVPRFIDSAGRHLVVDLVRESLGRSYDTTNVRNLLLSYIAAGRSPKEFIGNLEECQEMCSSLIARAFQTLGHPVLPDRHPSQILPRDFDLSPNFGIVKFNRLQPAPALPPGRGAGGPERCP